MSDFSIAPRVEAIRAAAELSEATLREAYWATCYMTRNALNPRDMGLPGWAEELLSEPFKAAQTHEASRGGWDRPVDFSEVSFARMRIPG